MRNIQLEVRPRESWTWERFAAEAEQRAIALDGMVLGGPRFDEARLLANFDHHDGVVREATMSTAMQVLFAIKGGLMRRFGRPTVYVNDTDQDTAMAVWLLEHHSLFEGASSVPSINRLLALTDRLDITGGAFPMNLDDALVEEHEWVFGAYSAFRTSGALARATSSEMAANLEATLGRLDRFLMGQHERTPLDRRSVVLGEVSLPGARVLVYDEIGGNSARYALYAQGMESFVAQVTTRADGRAVYSIGRRSRYVAFDVPRALTALSAADDAPWGGSDLIGGSNRERGSSLSPDDVCHVLRSMGGA